jgi:acyl-CoA synthetase (AMP-forming)/AMP-acid ligase II
MLLIAEQRVESVAALLGGLAAGYQIILQGSSANACAEADAAFRPDVCFDGQGLHIVEGGGTPVHPSAALLLSTSGTTGSSKFVRLPLSALIANAGQIAAVLDIAPHDVALAHLPIHYSYGLSVLTSHLHAGAAADLTDTSFTRAEFWQEAAETGATHLPGVPFHYMFLARGALRTLVPPAITSFTQAGGPLAAAVRQRIHADIASRGGRFYVLYGQTEAGPRMTTLDYRDFAAHPESVGRALPGGGLCILRQDGAVAAAGEDGEIVYSGPNLMAGYVTARAELAAPDTPLASIRTGDRGVLDEDGFLTLRGRNAGFAKVGGLRIDLDDVASRLAALADIALLPGEDKIHVFHVGTTDADITPRIRDLALDYAIPPGSFALHAIADIPRHGSGKVDYGRLRGMTG